MEDQRCCNSRRKMCQDCGQAYVKEHLELRKMEAFYADAKAETDKLRNELFELYKRLATYNKI